MRKESKTDEELKEPKTEEEVKEPTKPITTILLLRKLLGELHYASF